VTLFGSEEADLPWRGADAMEHLKNEARFAQFIEQPISLVFFCEQSADCDKVQPEFETAARRLTLVGRRGRTKAVPVGRLMVADSQTVMDRYELSSFPVALIFYNGTRADFEQTASDTRELWKAVSVTRSMDKAAATDWKPPPDFVLKLTAAQLMASNFSEETLGVLQFYAPKSEKCIRLGSEYLQAAKDMYKAGHVQGKSGAKTATWDRIPFVRVDATLPENKALVNEYNVVNEERPYLDDGKYGLPALFVVRKGVADAWKPGKFGGGGGITKHVKAMLQPPSVEVNGGTEHKFLKMLDVPIDFQADFFNDHPGRSGTMTMLACFEAAPSEADEANRRKFDVIAQAFRNQFQMVYTTKPEFCAGGAKALLGLRPGQMALVISRYASEREGRFDTVLLELADAPAQRPRLIGIVRSLVKTHALPLVGLLRARHERGEQIYDSLDGAYAGVRPLLLLFANVDLLSDFGRKQARFYRKPMLEAAKEFVGRVGFALANIDDFNKTLIPEFGLDGDAMEDVGICAQGEGSYKYRLEPDTQPTVALLTKLATELDEIQRSGGSSSAALKPFFRSEPKPRKGKKDAVRLVVGDTLRAVVLDTKKDVLLYLHNGAKCTACKELMPKITKLGRDLKAMGKNAKGMVVAAFDGSRNDAPPQFLQAETKPDDYPLIWWAPRAPKGEAKRLKLYKGEDGLEELEAEILKALLERKRKREAKGKKKKKKRKKQDL